MIEITAEQREQMLQDAFDAIERKLITRPLTTEEKNIIAFAVGMVMGRLEVRGTTQ